MVAEPPADRAGPVSALAQSALGRSIAERGARPGSRPGDLHWVFGAAGEHARSAFGVAQIPRGACVEIEMIAEIA
jgi:hypothetical protein